MIDWDTQPLRALLFAPGSDQRKLAKVGSFGADAIVIDLEDGVADHEKTSARAAAAEAIPTYDEKTVVMVRVNGRETGRMVDDIRSVVLPGLDGILLPKIEDLESLVEADHAATEAERCAGLPVGSIPLLGLIETARGLVGCEQILSAAPARLLTVAFGPGDFSADVGADITSDAVEMLYARSRIVVAARAAGLRRPIDGPYLGLFDAAGLAADTARSRQLGFQGRMVLYPPHVESTQQAYSVLAEKEVRRAQQVVEAFEQAAQHGVASIRVGGQFVDYPIYKRAKEKLSRHEACQIATRERG